MSDKNSKLKELVVYRVKPQSVEDFLNKGLPQLRACALKNNGMQEHLTYQSVKDKGVFIDWVTWDSLKDAEKAAAEMDEMMKSGELKELAMTFEKVEFFDHLNLVP